MTVPVQIIQNQLSHKAFAGAILRDGSVVSGRVISRNQNGSYSVSIAGQMIEVRSEANLKAGEVFSARVKIAENQVQLSLVQDSKSSGEMIQKFAPQNQNLSPQIQQFLSSLGFAPNLDSFKIVQFMQQIGVKIDVESAKKALAQSKKNGLVSEEKAQISFLLKEKGIASDDEKVSAILGKNPRDSENSQQQKKRENEDTLVISSEQRESRNLVSVVKNFFSLVDSAALTHKNGVLSDFNTILSKNKENAPLRHWIVLPFEWDFCDYAGNIKLLFDSELKNLEKVIIDLKNATKNSIFVLYFVKNALSSLRFASDFLAGDENRLSELLSHTFGREIPVERADFSELRGFCAGDEVLALVQGVV